MKQKTCCDSIQDLTMKRACVTVGFQDIYKNTILGHVYLANAQSLSFHLLHCNLNFLGKVFHVFKKKLL